jgi:two-component system cell cycle response regulator
MMKDDDDSNNIDNGTDVKDKEKTHVQPRTSIGDASVPETINAVLRVFGGEDDGREYEITKSNMVIGRGEEADIILTDTSTSRRHAAVIFRNLEFRIRDLGSSNGTFLNGSEVKEYALRNGDKIIVGDTMLKFIISRV